MGLVYDLTQEGIEWHGRNCFLEVLLTIHWSVELSVAKIMVMRPNVDAWGERLNPKETRKFNLFHSIKKQINITIKHIQQEVKIMVETRQASGGGLILLAIILAILLFLLPGLVLWLAWIGVIILFIGGLASLFAWQFSYSLEYVKSLFFSLCTGCSILQRFLSVGPEIRT